MGRRDDGAAGKRRKRARSPRPHGNSTPIYQGLLPAVPPTPAVETPPDPLPGNEHASRRTGSRSCRSTSKAATVRSSCSARRCRGSSRAIPTRRRRFSRALSCCGRDSTSRPAQPYFVYEEEVPRAGSVALQSFERTRWSDGRVYVWLRVRRTDRSRRRLQRPGLRRDRQRAPSGRVRSGSPTASARRGKRARWRRLDRPVSAGERSRPPDGSARLRHRSGRYRPGD